MADAMTPAECDRLAGYLNRLPFVQWDRMIRDTAGFRVYGWISRPDGRSDFVVVEGWRPFDDSQIPGFTTSSAALSEAISEALYEVDGLDGHLPCERVEDVLGDRVAFKVELAGATLRAMRRSSTSGWASAAAKVVPFRRTLRQILRLPVAPR